MMMIRKMMKKSKEQKGFTLIELIVVIAILGILAAIAIPRLSGFSDNAEETAKEATARTITSAYTLYEADTDTDKTWPDDYLSEYDSVNATTGDITVNSVVYTNDGGIWTGPVSAD